MRGDLEQSSPGVLCLDVGFTRVLLAVRGEQATGTRVDTPRPVRRGSGPGWEQQKGEK